MAFLAECGIELSDERLDAIAAGKLFGNSRKSCPNNKEGHEWVFTGRTRPGSIWGDKWPDYENRCKYCGTLEWKWTK